VVGIANPTDTDAPQVGQRAVPGSRVSPQVEQRISFGSRV
jgi:hypothetical protein